MRKGIFLAFASLVIALSTYAAHLWLVVLENSMGNFSPPFEGNLPFDAPATPLTSEVVLLVAEGLSPNALSQMKYTGSLREKGAYIPLDAPYAPGNYTRWGVLLTGATPDVIGIYPEPFPIPTGHLFEAAGRSGRTIAFAGPRFWRGLLSASRGYFYASFFGREDEPARVAEEASRFIRHFHPQFAFVHLTGFTGPRYVDALIRQVVDAFDLADGTLALLFLSDRGNALVLVGRGVKAGTYETASVTDVAPTLAALLGTPIPPQAQGRILFPALSMSTEVEAEKAVALARQRVNFADLYLVKLLGKGLKESIKGDAVAAQSSLEVKNYRAALELARLAVDGADRAMAEARVKVVRSGQWRRLSIAAGVACGLGLAFLLWGKGWGAVLLLGGALSAALNAYLFRQQVSGTLPLSGAPMRTLMALVLPALLPLGWALTGKKVSLTRMVEVLAGYALASLYFAWLVVLFCFWRMGVAVSWPLPSAFLYWIYTQALREVILSGLIALVVVFPAMLAVGIYVLLGYAGMWKVVGGKWG